MPSQAIYTNIALFAKLKVSQVAFMFQFAKLYVHQIHHIIIIIVYGKNSDQYEVIWWFTKITFDTNNWWKCNMMPSIELVDQLTT